MTTAQKERIEYLRGKGDSYAAIAADLGISENTVKSYCRRNNIGVAIKQELPVDTDACANCGIPLQHMRGSKQKRFCSDKCSMAWWKAHPEAVDRKLKEFELQATQKGKAIAFIHPYPAVMNKVQDWVKEADSKGIQVAPLSAMVQ